MTLDQARAQICAILSELEVDSGQNVESISLLAFDVTTLASTNEQLQMDVAIELRRAPGHGWSSGGA